MSAFVRVPNLPPTLRTRYLASLPEPQEWFLEEQVRTGENWVSADEGYAVFHGDALVEFYTPDSGNAQRRLSKLLRQRPFRTGLCTSFNHLLIGAAKHLGWELVETGFLFRKRSFVILDEIENFTVARATAANLPEAWGIGRDFYDSKEEVNQIFQSDGLWIASIDGEMVANGVTIPVDDTGNIVDVGMVTRRSHRSKGIGSLLVARLATLLEGQGKRPICGCAESNLASKCALEKAGFVSEHRLVRMTIPE